MMSDRDQDRLNYLSAAKYVYQIPLDQEEQDELDELFEKERHGRS